MLDFKGKTILITGATGGIGGAAVECLHGLGANIVASGTNTDKLAALEAKYPERLKAFKCDLSDMANIEDFYKSAEAAFEGGLDAVVCNAGITRDNLLLRMKESEWDEVLNINLKAVFKLNQLAAKAMSRRRKGSIINIASVVGLSGNMGQTNYVAAKAGMIGMTKNVALEVAKRGITANCIAPGFTKTAMTDALDEATQDAIKARIPLGRIGGADEIASCIAFLASDQSRYITGQVISVNGGMYM